MDRREFIKLTALTGAGLSLSDGISRIVEAAESSTRPDLVVAHGASPEQIVTAAVDAMGGIKTFICGREFANGQSIG